MSKPLTKAETLFLNRISQKLYGNPNKWREFLLIYKDMDKIEAEIVKETLKQRKESHGKA